jgi:hypothetical protein
VLALVTFKAWPLYDDADFAAPTRAGSYKSHFPFPPGRAKRIARLMPWVREHKFYFESLLTYSIAATDNAISGLASHIFLTDEAITLTFAGSYSIYIFYRLNKCRL